MIERRRFLIGLIAAPAIVRIASLMPVRALTDHASDLRRYKALLLSRAYTFETGLAYYDLEAPAKMLFPEIIPCDDPFYREFQRRLKLTPLRL